MFAWLQTIDVLLEAGSSKEKSRPAHPADSDGMPGTSLSWILLIEAPYRL
jgi:hypothetical protein